MSDGWNFNLGIDPGPTGPAVRVVTTTPKVFWNVHFRSCGDYKDRWTGRSQIRLPNQNPITILISLVPCKVTTSLMYIWTQTATRIGVEHLWPGMGAPEWLVQHPSRFGQLLSLRAYLCGSTCVCVCLYVFVCVCVSVFMARCLRAFNVFNAAFSLALFVSFSLSLSLSHKHTCTHTPTR